MVAKKCSYVDNTIFSIPAYRKVARQVIVIFKTEIVRGFGRSFDFNNKIIVHTLKMAWYYIFFSFNFILITKN